MYFTSGGEGKFYFVIFFNKPSNNLFIFKASTWLHGWWLGGIALVLDLGISKRLCVQTTYRPSTTNLNLGVANGLVRSSLLLCFKEKFKNSFHHMLHWMKIEWWWMNSIDEQKIKLYVYHEFFKNFKHFMNYNNYKADFGINVFRY
jgi:hypothetical protein